MRLTRRSLAGLVFALTLCGWAAAQPLKLGVITDTHIGSGAAAAAGLSALVDTINADPSIRFVFVTGDVTEKGSDAELAEAKTILDRLKVPCRVLPGNHDTHWLGHGGAGFVRVFGEDRFAFEAAGFAFLGLSAWDQGHFAPDDMAWLESRVRGIPVGTDIFFFVHFPPENIDNWARVHEALRTHRVVAIVGHGHADRQSFFHGLPVWMVRAGLGRNGEPPGMAVVTIDLETIEIARPDGDGSLRLWGAFARRGREPLTAIEPAPLLPAKAEVLWHRDLGRRLLAEPVFDGKRLYAADQRGRITCWDSQGRLVWTYEAKAPFVSRPAVQGKFLLAATADGKIIKLDAATGGHFNTGDLGLHPTSPIVPFEDVKGKIARFLLGTDSGRLLCVNSFNLTSFWASDAAKGLIQAAPLIAGKAIFFGAWDGAAHALDLATGRALWRWTENDNFYYSPAGCTPVSDGKNVFFCSPDGFVSAVHPANGKTIWRVKAAAWESIGLSGDGRRLLIKSRLDEFHILDAATGAELKWITPAHGAGELGPASPVEHKGRILYGAKTGRVLSIDAAGRVETILDLGPGAVHTLIAMGGGRFAASTIDGVVVVFRIPE